MDQSISIMARMSGRVSVMVEGCWRWNGSTNCAGYGVIRINNKSALVHRLVVKAIYLDLKSTDHVHHLCEAKYCLNPSHLVAITASHHCALNPNWSGRAKRWQTKCKYGHEFSEQNTHHTKNGGRQCKACIGMESLGVPVRLDRQITCQVCQFTWYPRKERIRICPTCKSGRWNDHKP